MTQEQYNVKCYIEVDRNLRALGYEFTSVESFFDFIGSNVLTQKTKEGYKFTFGGLFLCEVKIN